VRPVKALEHRQRAADLDLLNEDGPLVFARAIETSPSAKSSDKRTKFKSIRSTALFFLSRRWLTATR